MRQSVSLSRHATAKLLRVSLRTLHNWETGKVRIPYAAYKLIRLFNSYEIFHPIWKDWRIVGSRLVTPEGHSLEAANFHWLTLMARRADAFGKIHRQRVQLQKQAKPHIGAAAAEAFTGLVYNSTSRTENTENQQIQGLDWGAPATPTPTPKTPQGHQAAYLPPDPDGLPVRLHRALLTQQLAAQGGAL